MSEFKLQGLLLALALMPYAGMWVGCKSHDDVAGCDWITLLPSARACRKAKDTEDGSYYSTASGGRPGIGPRGGECYRARCEDV